MTNVAALQHRVELQRSARAGKHNSLVFGLCSTPHLAAELAVIAWQHLVPRLGAVLAAAPLVENHLWRLAGVVPRAASDFHHPALLRLRIRRLRLHSMGLDISIRQVS
jgi:hypothetical protein